MARVTFKQLSDWNFRAEVESSMWIRRHTLLAIADIAKRSPDHDGGTRRRLAKFRKGLDAMEGDDEIEIASPIFSEVTELAMRTLTRDQLKPW